MKRAGVCWWVPLPLGSLVLTSHQPEDQAMYEYGEGKEMLVPEVEAECGDVVRLLLLPVLFIGMHILRVIVAFADGLLTILSHMQAGTIAGPGHPLISSRQRSTTTSNSTSATCSSWTIAMIFAGIGTFPVSLTSLPMNSTYPKILTSYTYNSTSSNSELSYLGWLQCLTFMFKFKNGYQKFWISS
jgi:hypothetical protein